MLNYKRALAKIYSQHPLLSPVAGIMLGELLRCAWHSALWIKCILALPLGVALLFSRRGGWTAGSLTFFTLFGFLLQHATTSKPLADQTFERRGVLVRIDDVIRQRRTDETELPLRVLGHFDLQHGLGMEFGDSSLQRGERVICKAVNLPWRNVAGSRVGDTLVIAASFRPILEQGIFDYGSTLLRQGFTHRCKLLAASQALDSQTTWDQRVRQYLINLLVDHLGDTERSGLLLSLFLGVRDLLHESTERAFKHTGLGHLLVFSGYQVVLFYSALLFASNLALRLIAQLLPMLTLRVSAFVSLRQLSHCHALVLTCLFEAVAGFERSTLRASLALLFFVIARLSEREGTFINAMLFALFCMCALAPGCFLEPGTQFTFAALSGIALSQDSLALSWWNRYFSAQCCILLCTTPLMLLWFGQGSLVALPLNLVLAPLVSFLACNLGALFTLLLVCGFDRQALLLGYLADLLLLLRDIVIAISKWPWVWFELDSGLALGATLCALVPLVILSRRRLVNFLNCYPGVWKRK